MRRLTRFGPGDRILTAQAEYASNFIAYLHVARRTGAVIDVIPNDASGQLSIEALRAMMDERVKLIAITHVPTNGGLVNPARAIGQVAREWQAPFLLDACQSVGQLQMQVDDLGCDMLAATGRKYLRGPRGTGFLYVRQALLDRLDPPFLDLHAATWTAPDHYVVRQDARRTRPHPASHGPRPRRTALRHRHLYQDRPGPASAPRSKLYRQTRLLLAAGLRQWPRARTADRPRERVAGGSAIATTASAG